MTIIIAPDKFKGSLTSLEACIAIREGIRGKDKSIETLLFPMADGGDGFAEVMKYYTDTASQSVQSVDALGREIESSYEWNPQKRVAIVELASCSGQAMLKKEERDPMKTSSYGTGLQIMDAIKRGAKKIVLGLGGSATNDAGTGILSAMGFTFHDKFNEPVRPCGENLAIIEKISPPARLPAVAVEIACDVSNPLYGPEGAAMVFSPQKGATAYQAQLLDNGLRRFAETLKRSTGKDVSGVPGTGAAGGIAAGLLVYLNAYLVNGTKLIIKASGIENAFSRTNYIITGEGKIDHQSLKGKAIWGIVELAKEKRVPVLAICGKLDLTGSEWKQLGLAYASEIDAGNMNEEERIRNASFLLTKTTTSILKNIIAKQ